jgi:hypothetical protein
MNDVEQRIIDISYREKIPHLSSNLECCQHHRRNLQEQGG